MELMIIVVVGTVIAVALNKLSRGRLEKIRLGSHAERLRESMRHLQDLHGRLASKNKSKDEYTEAQFNGMTWPIIKEMTEITFPLEGKGVVEDVRENGRTVTFRFNGRTYSQQTVRRSDLAKQLSKGEEVGLTCAFIKPKGNYVEAYLALAEQILKDGPEKTTLTHIDNYNYHLNSQKINSPEAWKYKKQDFKRLIGLYITFNGVLSRYGEESDFADDSGDHGAR